MLLALVATLSSCHKSNYQGSMLKKNEIKQLEEAKSFNINQAKKIIEHNEKNKRKRMQFADKQRKNQQDYLESLNKNPKTVKAHKTKAPILVDFY